MCKPDEEDDDQESSEEYDKGGLLEEMLRQVYNLEKSIVDTSLEEILGITSKSPMDMSLEESLGVTSKPSERKT